MKVHYTSIFCFFISLVLSAQQMPIDFSDNSHVFSAFGGSGFSTRNNPEDNGDTVAQFFNDGSQAWQGFAINLTRPIDLSSQQEISLDFYRFDPNSHAITVRLESGTEQDVEVIVNVSSGSGNEWINNVIFNFANAKATIDGSSVNAMGSYSRMVLFIDGGVTTPGTYLMDDITDGSTPTDPHQLDIVYNDLVWEDNFDGSSIDAAKWHHQTQVIIPGVGWANGEDQHYTARPENSFVQNGDLHIVAKREQYTSEGITMPFTSARMNSKFAFTYGRVDVRAKLPEGLGTWPAIWMLGRNVNERGGYFQPQFGAVGWPACGEIDIMEHGLGAVNEVSSALHTTSSSGATVNFEKKVISDVADNYHVYSVNWSPNQMTFLIDGVGYYTYVRPPVFVDVGGAGFNQSQPDGIHDGWPFDAPQYLLLNVAMGGTPVNGGNVDPNFTESSMIIDYVRVYQNVTASTEDVFATKFSIYPNPVNTEVNIRTTEVVDKIEVYSLLGQLVISQKNTKRVETNELKSGLYLMHIYSNGKKVTKKLIKK